MRDESRPARKLRAARTGDPASKTCYA